MVNAGRVLIIPKGAWSNLVTYEMLDLVTAGDIAYIAKQSSVGQNPANDTAMTYWQPFGTAAKIATTSEPGLVMPDGTTISVDSTGLISAVLGITGLTDVTLTTLSNGQILRYNGSTSKWENISLGSAAYKASTNAVTQSSTDLVESGAVYTEVNTLNQALANKYGTDDTAETTIDDADYFPFYDTSATAKRKSLWSNIKSVLKTYFDTIYATVTDVTNKHKITRKWVDTTSWTQDTTSQSGSTLYKKTLTLSHLYVSSPSIDIANANNSDLPSVAQQTDYDLLQYVVADDSGPSLDLYATAIPTTGFWINMEGAD